MFCDKLSVRAGVSPFLSGRAARGDHKRPWGQGVRLSVVVNRSVEKATSGMLESQWVSGIYEPVFVRESTAFYVAVLFFCGWFARAVNSLRLLEDAEILAASDLRPGSTMIRVRTGRSRHCRS